MIAYVVTEGPADRELLRRLPPPDLMVDVEVVAAGGQSSVVSMARSLLVRRQVPVALVMDADTTDERAIQERRESIEAVVRMVAGDLLVAIILAVPDLEMVFFHDISVLERLSGQPIPPEILSLARASSRTALKELCTQTKACRDRAEILASLTQEDAEKLRGAPPIQELIRFLEQARETASRSSGVLSTG